MGWREDNTPSVVVLPHLSGRDRHQATAMYKCCLYPRPNTQRSHLHVAFCLQLWPVPCRHVWKGLLRPRQGEKAVVTEQTSPMPEDTEAQVGSWGEAVELDNICPLHSVHGGSRWCHGCGEGGLRAAGSLGSSSRVCMCVFL